MLSYSFGPYVFVPERQSLWRDHTAVRVGSRALEILAALIERPGEVVGKAELVSRAWPDTFVEQSNLKVNVAALRRALGDAPDGTQYIATVSGRGYRFVFPVSVSGQSAAAVAAKLQGGGANNFPVSTTRLVGRDHAIDAIRAALEASRLLTIVGPGGVGKTKLALAIAGRLTAAYEHGVWFVDLATVNDATLVPTSIATALGLRVHSANIKAAIAAFAADREFMLVLDNCEHVIEAVAACVEALLAAAARVRILATSREPLRVLGEQVYRLPPLETPPKVSRLSAAEALAFPAVELFVERAAGSRGVFVLEDEDAPVVAEICRRLDGLALAIELAAPRLDAFSTSELLGFLADQSPVLSDRRGGDTRHHTLAATLDWSFGLLAEPERVLLRRLSVFAGAFSVESACVVAVDKGRARSECIHAIANLVAKSLVSIERGEFGTLYRLLDTTRRYAQQKLTENGEGGSLRQRHAEHLLELAKRAEAEWKIRPTAHWLADYGKRMDDLRSALGWALSGSGDAAIAVALTVAALPFWEHLSLTEECRAGAELALSSRFTKFRSPVDEMKLQFAYGTALLHTRGPLPQVKAAWITALGCAESLNDTDYRLRCLWGLCDYFTWTGDHHSALAMAEKIRVLATDRGDLDARINVDRQTGTALRYLGELAEAQRHLERMIARYIPPVARSDIARFQLDPRSAARGTLANVAWLQGHPDRAVAMAQRQLEEARAAQHALALCNAVVHTTCPIALLTGDLATAERLLLGIEAHVAEHAMTVWSAMSRCLRAEWLLQSGDASGLTMLRRALDELLAVHFRVRCPFYIGIYAAALGTHGDVDAGRIAIEEAIALSASTGEIWCMPELLRIKADLLSKEGTSPTADAAEALFLQAVDLARRQGALSWELRAATALAEHWHRTDQGAKAVGVLAPVYRRFNDGLATRDVLKARTLLNVLGDAGKRRDAVFDATSGKVSNPVQ
ncbi:MULTISPECIES: ATP-binding protein [Rhizobium]|uniref:Putative ATPase/DNA-binding winged helix-turn-helix (WHTH) protein n=1 Tax=Rhizobium esperanzae TaxID=1967781 RepID=A0A7W6UT76_9HYPH|nr:MULTISPECIES: winged helix-turn-helix domain-containing protein [Rhizobium]MBB4443893.1 putative ATPase/DNA-binding winged helix-turn-helix (wHTH) protein [Rhizobium esperanzae]MDH6206497.1 putative ATPase/DNA-binding winged helix-turn-helix (wHTH) protein [Rhizobium leguminosarum]